MRAAYTLLLLASNLCACLAHAQVPPAPVGLAGRHALIIGVSRYADASITTLAGVPKDRQSATQMATAMQVPSHNIHYLTDEAATGDGIRQAIADLSIKVADGDRVFIYYSGHGTRYMDQQAGGCVEALLAHDGGSNSRGVISNNEMAQLLSGITQKTDKLFVMYDACHSGGVLQNASTSRTRSLAANSAESHGSTLHPKVAAVSDACARPANMRTRSLAGASVAAGTLPQDIIYVSASQADEISFDDERTGGLATQFMRDCMLRDARDSDNSGGISMEEIRQCAQKKLDARLANDPFFKAHHVVINGNAEFVPAWFGQSSTQLPARLPEQSISAVDAKPSLDFSGRQALEQLYQQRNGKRTIELRAASTSVRIGVDPLNFTARSHTAGYLYIIAADASNETLTVLFPNKLDTNNRIAAGQTLALPRPSWRIKSAGPAGHSHLLAVVTDAPRDLSEFGASKESRFLASANTATLRTRLGKLFTQDASCAQEKTCSASYGAALVSIEELP